MRRSVFYSGVQYYLMGLLVLLVGIVQITAAARVSIVGVKPDLALVLIILWTLVYGSRSGLVWAFLAGAWLDIFSNGPMGATSLGYMVAALFAGLGYRTFSRFNLLVPLVATAGGTILYALVYLFIMDAMALVATTLGFMVSDYRLPFQETVENVVVPLMMYNTTLTLIAVPFLNQIPGSGSIPSLSDE